MLSLEGQLHECKNAFSWSEVMWKGITWSFPSKGAAVAAEGEMSVQVAELGGCAYVRPQPAAALSTQRR